MVKCSAPLCGNATYKKTPEITFHRFPKDEKMKLAWITNMKRQDWQPTSSSVLCSKHFEPHLIDQSGFRTVVVSGAIPTIFDLLEENIPTVASDHVLSCDYAHNEQPSTSASAASPQHKEPLVSLTRPIKRIASRDYNLPEIKSSRSQHNTFTAATTGQQQVLREIHNMIQPGVSSVFPNYDEDNRKKEEKIRELTNKALLKNKRIKALKQQNRRLKKKVSKFSEVISSLKEKLNQDEMHIMSGMNIKNKDFFVRYLKKAKGSTLSKSFPPELRAFALQLNFYSARAYSFVRNSFNTVLPHPATLSRWYKKIDAEPGFTSESFQTLEALAKDSKHEVLVNLSLDEMAIRKGLVWDGTANKFKGYVDTGTNVYDDSLPLATQALVILVTAINFNWLLPIAYFFIHSMTGEQRANIVKMAIQMLFDINVFVCGLTFDGAASNIAMATHLGCDFNLKHLQPFFIINNRKINVFYDPCHMIKLVRNTLGDFGSLIDEDGNVIDFKYLRLLLELQTEKGLHLANKLKQAHIQFGKQKMKVRLAVQLLSKSVADALSFCEENFAEFKGARATIKFISVINDAFDVLNSRSTLAPGYKKALCDSNIEMTKTLTAEWLKYIMNLKLPNGHLIINSARKTGFVGFIVSIRSAFNLYEDLVSKGKLRFLTLYKISQDFLEMFFGKMRARGGFNDNPNVVQFKTAYKKNIVQIKIKMEADGFNIPNTILTTSSSKNVVDVVNDTTPNFEKNLMELHDLNEDFIDSFLENIISNPLDVYTHNVTIYIAGFIARKIMKNINCYKCQMLMIGEKENFFKSLICKKDRGGLTYPSDGLIKIIQLCEKFLKMYKGNVNYTSLITYIADSSNYYSDFKTNDEHDINHLYLLVSLIAKYYIDLRMKHDAKQSNISDRNYLKKMILFKNK